MILNGKNKLTFRLFVLLLVSVFILVTAFSSVYPESGAASGPEILLSQTVYSVSPRPGDSINFTISYLNPSTSIAYNLTVFESIPTELVFASSKPFYDGVSNPEEGFLRWSRGDIAPGEGGTVMVRMIVKNVIMGTNITNTAHLTFENGEGATVELTATASVIVAHGAGVAVFPDEIHGIPPCSHAETSYNVTVTNIGNALDVFDLSLSSLVFDPTPAGKQWTIELFNATGHLVARLYDNASDDHNSWTDWGILTTVRLDIGESTWYMIHEVSSEGVSGSGDAYTKVRLTATSQFDAAVSDDALTITVVRSAVGITLAPDNSAEANPGQTVTFLHGLFNGGKAETIDIAYSSTQRWTYRFFFANGTALQDTNGNGYVDVGRLEKDGHADLMVKVTVPYGTPAGTVDHAVITATGFDSGRSDAVTDCTVVRTCPSLSVVKELVSGNPAYVGDTVTYIVNITNLGNTNLTQIPLDDAFETSSVDFESANPTPDSYSEISGTIHWENITRLRPLQSAIVTVNFLATGGDSSVRQSTSVIDAEDECGNLVSAVCVNTQLEIRRLFSLAVSTSSADTLGGTFDAEWTLRGTIHTGTFTTPAEITCDESTTASLGNAQEFILKDETRYALDSYSVPSPILMESNVTVLLNYRTQSRVTFTQSGLDFSATSTVVIVSAEPKTYADLPFTTDWLDSGCIVNFEYSDLVNSSTVGRRFRLETVNTTSPIVLGESTTVGADYVVQNLATFDAAGLDGSAVGTVVAVNGDTKALSELPFSMWMDDGASVNYVYETLVSSQTAEKRFRLDSVSGPESPTVVTEPFSACGNYVVQYRLVVVSDHGTTGGTGWYDQGSTAYAEVDPLTVPGPEGVRFIFTHWSGDASGDASPSDAITMDAPKTAVAEWKTQYLVSFGQSGLDETAASNVMTVENESKPIGDLPFAKWVDEGAAVNYVYDNIVSSNVVGRRFMLDGITGPASPIIVTSPTTVAGNYVTQHLIEFSVTGLDASATGAVVTVEGSTLRYAGLPFSTWLDDRMIILYNYEALVSSLEDGKRFRLVNITGPDSPINATCAIAVTGSYVAQYNLTVNTNPAEVLGLDPSAVSEGGWYDAGTVASVDAVQTVPKVAERSGYDFRSWTGATPNIIGNQATVLMNAAKTATANYQLRHAVIFDQTGIGEDFTGTVAVINGTTYSADSLPALFWLDENSAYEFAFTSPLSLGGKRYVWSSTAGLTSLQSGTLNVSAPGTVLANYKTQYYLTMGTNFGTVTPGSGWHDAASMVTVSASAPTSTYGEQYVWYNWTGAGASSYSGPRNPANVTMNSPVDETAYWKMLPTLTINVTEETVARCDRILVAGTTRPTASTVPVQVTYTFPNGTQVTHTVMTDDEGNYNDTLMLGQESAYGLFTQKGEWIITADREGNVNQETAVQSTQMVVTPADLSQFSLALLALIVACIGALIYAFILRRVNREELPRKSWWDGAVVLAIAAITVGVVALVLNWTLAIGTVSINGQNYQVSFSLNPFSPAHVSITGLEYIGKNIPSLTDSAWQSIPKSLGPIMTIFLLPVGCGLALVSLYRPKTQRQRIMKVATLIAAGTLILTPMVHSLLFVQGQASAIAGTSTGYGTGQYLAIVSGLLALFAGFFAAKEAPLEPAQTGATTSTVEQVKK